jgi:RNA ligase (TIGR02306 family)
VAKKGEFSPGDDVLYIEVDAALPVADARFAFLAARGTKAVAGNAVHVLKTAKLRWVYSQGIVFPLSAFPEAHTWLAAPEGRSLDDVLGVTLWEPPIPGGMTAIGPFPSFLVKTDAERVQNLDAETWAAIRAESHAWLATEKVDGSSLTAWVTGNGELHVAGRNWELDPGHDNAHWHTARTHLAPHLVAGWWVQAEVVGPGIQANPLGLTSTRLVVFGVGMFDADAPALATTSRLPRDAWPSWALAIAAPTYHVPLPVTIEEAIAQTERLDSLVSPGRAAEGIVWTHRDGAGLAGLGGRAVWKSISARYLIKHGG